MIQFDDMQRLLEGRHGADRQEKLSSAVVGIAGLGGLGSHVATHLTRLGVGRLILVDFDTVDESNLHRQAYFMDDVGKAKHEALIVHLKRINPYLIFEGHNLKLTSENIPTIFKDCQIICEAFDVAEQKAMLTECVLANMPHTILVGASGMAGTGNPNAIKAKQAMKRYFLCGDGVSDVLQEKSLFAPRVALCAAQQACVIMQQIIGEVNITE